MAMNQKVISFLLWKLNYLFYILILIRVFINANTVNLKARNKYAPVRQGATRRKNSPKLSKNSKRDRCIVHAHPPQWTTMRPSLAFLLSNTIVLCLLTMVPVEGTHRVTTLYSALQK